MEGQKLIKVMLTDANKSSRDLADAFGTSKATAANKVYKGITSLKDFLTIANACGATVSVTLGSGVIIPLTLADLEEPSKGK